MNDILRIKQLDLSHVKSLSHRMYCSVKAVGIALSCYRKIIQVFVLCENFTKRYLEENVQRGIVPLQFILFCLHLTTLCFRFLYCVFIKEVEPRVL